MAVRCPTCNCGHCPVEGPSKEKTIHYRGRPRIYQRRRRVCAHCGTVFYTREFHEHAKSGPASPLNPLFHRDLEEPKSPESPSPEPPPAANPFLKGPDDAA